VASSVTQMIIHRTNVDVDIFRGDVRSFGDGNFGGARVVSWTAGNHADS